MIVAWDWRDDLFVYQYYWLVMVCLSAEEGTMREEDRWCLDW